MNLHQKLAAVGIGLLLAGAGFAIAQTTPVPTVTNVGPNDLFNDVVNGVPQVGNRYASASQIAGVPGYYNMGTISTDAAYHVTNGVTNIFAHATGTVTVETITTEPNPGDGKRECYWADQATTTLTWSANTGQTVDGNVVAAGTQYVSNCITFVTKNATWYSSN